MTDLDLKELDRLERETCVTSHDLSYHRCCEITDQLRPLLDLVGRMGTALEQVNRIAKSAEIPMLRTTRGVIDEFLGPALTDYRRAKEESHES